MRLFLEEHPLTNKLTSLQLHCTAPERPALVVELTTGLRIRVRLGEHPLLHARVHPAYDGVWLLRSPAAFTAIFPPFQEAELRQIPDAPRSAAWFLRWARRFAELCDQHAGPLHSGDWLIEPDVPLTKLADPSRTLLRPGALLYERWWGGATLLTLRDPSPASAARVKALRKQARAGTLPPLLALYVSGLAIYVLLDGHDRLQAAELEGQTPTLLALVPIRKTAVAPAQQDEVAPRLARGIERSVPPGRILTRAQIQNLNEILIRAYSTTELTTKTRAYPLAGGSARWNAEVSERLRALAIPVVPGLIDERWTDSGPRFGAANRSS